MKMKILSILALIFCIGLFSTLSYGENNTNTDQITNFTLKPLPYATDALEPYMDQETVIIHHDKHQQAYVDNLNKALAKYPELYSKGLAGLLTDINSLPSDIKQKVINNAGGVYNHEFFWDIIAPNSGGNPIGKLADAINTTFGSYDNFKAQFKQAGLDRFGSGWAWLVSDGSGKLSIISTANQDSPISQGLTPIIGVDVWEHAYYLMYQNKRGDYIDNWFNLINWQQAEKNYTS